MLMTASHTFVYGTITHEAAATVAAPVLTGLQAVERLAGFVKAHDDLSVELASARGRLNRAAAYLGGAACNQAFGLANLERLRAKHSEALTRLRANRLAARAFLNAMDADAPVG